MLAVIDSGCGGLTVLSEIRKVYRGDVLYIGDTLRAPYGSRSDEELRGFTKEMLVFAKLHGATHFVSACNSISVRVTNELLQETGIGPDVYIDMVRVTERYGIGEKMSSLVIVATEATTRSHVYSDLFHGAVNEVEEIALPLLAGAIEKADHKEITAAFLPLNQKNLFPSHIFLGCTHYPFVKELFKRQFSQTVIIDPAQYVALAVRDWHLQDVGGIHFCLTKESLVFRQKVKELGLDANARLEEICLQGVYDKLAVV